MNQPYPGSAEHVAYFPRWLHRLWWGFMAVVLIATAWLGWFDWHQTRDRETVFSYVNGNALVFVPLTATGD